MKESGPIVRRGEVWLIDFRLGRGSEQLGGRPAVVIQNDIGNQYASTTIVAALTTTMKIYPITVKVDRGEGGLKQLSMVNLAQVLTLDKTRLQKRLGALSPQTMARVSAAIRVSLDLD